MQELSRRSFLLGTSSLAASAGVGLPAANYVTVISAPLLPPSDLSWEQMMIAHMKAWAKEYAEHVNDRLINGDPNLPPMGLLTDEAR